jgi:hypothetical protein
MPAADARGRCWRQAQAPAFCFRRTSGSRAWRGRSPVHLGRAPRSERSHPVPQDFDRCGELPKGAVAQERPALKLTEVPTDSKFLDVDGIPVVKLPTGNFVAFDECGRSRPYPNTRKADLEGDVLTADEFRAWISTGRNRFDRA